MFEILHTLEFDSDRKCMSVIVRRKGDSQVILYSKGADSVIYRNLVHPTGLLPEEYNNSLGGQEEREQDVPNRAELTQMHLNMYARLGLRTLCLAKRVFMRMCVLFFFFPYFSLTPLASFIPLSPPSSLLSSPFSSPLLLPLPPLPSFLPSSPPPFFSLSPLHLSSSSLPPLPSFSPTPPPFPTFPGSQSGGV